MMMKTFKRFSRLMNERLSNSVHTTEDSIRYTFFWATQLPPTSIVLEEFHSKKARERIDAILHLPDGKKVAVEFKYHKALRTGSARPRPLQAGSVVADLERLNRYRDADEKYLVYVTDQEMVRYMKNARNGLADLFDGA